MDENYCYKQPNYYTFADVSINGVSKELQYSITSSFCVSLSSSKSWINKQKKTINLLRKLLENIHTSPCILEAMEMGYFLNIIDHFHMTSE